MRIMRRDARCQRSNHDKTNAARRLCLRAAYRYACNFQIKSERPVGPHVGGPDAVVAADAAVFAAEAKRAATQRCEVDAAGDAAGPALVIADLIDAARQRVLAGETPVAIQTNERRHLGE